MEGSTSRGFSQDATERGRGGGSYRGRGRGRGGRGRGRGANPQSTQTTHGDFKNPRGRGGGGNRQGNSPRLKLTHFLALPLGHHPTLRQRMGAFTRSLLENDPPIAGLDQSIVISPRRLHLTLGVMSLDAESTDVGQGLASAPRPPSQPRTLQSAVTLLQDLRPRIVELLENAQLNVVFDRVDIMRPDEGNLEKAHVMWVGPSYDGEDTQRLKRVSEFINQEFRKAGLVMDEKRPLKLHCTILNTVYRKPRTNGRRLSFSYAAILDSLAFRSIEAENQDSTNSAQRGRRPIPVDLGKWTVDEVQICEMGSWGPEGEYVCVGRIPLH